MYDMINSIYYGLYKFRYIFTCNCLPLLYFSEVKYISKDKYLICSRYSKLKILKTLTYLKAIFQKCTIVQKYHEKKCMMPENGATRVAA